MSESAGRTLWIGTGSTSPSVWTKSDRGFEQVIDIPDGHSVYVLALSFSGGRLLVGTRNRDNNDKFGRVFLYDVRTDPPQLRQSWWQETSVTAGALVTDEIGITGGLHGKLSFWKEGSQKPIASIKAHNGAVLAVRALNKKGAATIGSDGVMRIWNLDSLEAVATRPSPTGERNTSALLDLAWARDAGMLFSLHPDGHVLQHVIEQSASGPELKTRRLGVNQKKYQSICTCGRFLVCSALNGALLYTLSLEDGELISTAECMSPVHRVRSYSNNEVVALHSESDQVGFYRVGPQSARIASVDLSHTRSIATPCRPFLLNQAAKATAHKRSERLQEMQSMVNKSNFKTIYQRAQQLTSEGAGTEALIMLASWAEKHEYPGIELEARLQLTNQLPTEPWCAPHYYALADLLEAWGEPEEALKVFNQVARCDDTYRDVTSRISSLSTKEIPSQSDSRPLVRDDLNEHGLAAPVVQKYKLLGKQWTDLITMLREPEQWEAAADAEELARLIKGVREALSDDVWDAKTLTISGDGQLREVMLFITSFAGNPKGIRYAFEIKDTGGQLIFVHRLLSLIPEDIPEDAKFEYLNHVFELSQHSTMYRNKSEMQLWYAGVKEEVIDTVERVYEDYLDSQKPARF